MASRINFEPLIYLVTSLLVAPRYKNPRLLAKDRETVKTILVVHLGHLGEMVLATAALACLRRQFPDAKITLLGGPWATPVVAGSSLVDEILPYAAPAFARGATDAPSWHAVREALSHRHFDMILDLRKDFSVLRYEASVPAKYLLDNGVARVRRHSERFGDRGRHFFQRYLDTLRLGGIPTEGAALALEIPEADREWAIQKLRELDLTNGKYAVLHPFASVADRDWPAENFARVADRLREEKNLPVLLTGPSGERGRAEALAELCRIPPLNLVGETSLHQLAALFASAGLVLSNDSGGAHVAAGAGARLVVLFGPATQYWLTAPWSERAIVMNASRELADISIPDVMEVVDEQLGVGASSSANQGDAWPFRLKTIAPQER